jgi:predicted ATP-grasp superfamily ATP-dependent carboligase
MTNATSAVNGATADARRVGTVVVADLEGRGSLAACRSLSRAGYRVLGVSSSRFAPGSWSRSCDRRIVLPDPRAGHAGYVRALADAIAGEGVDVLVPGSDATLVAVSAHRDVVAPHVDPRLPSHDVVLRVTDKAAIGEAASAVGLAPPTTIGCATLDDVRAAAGELGYPLVLKPQRSATVAGDVLRERRSRKVATPAELERGVAELGVPLLAQEAVGGAVHSVAGVVAEGRLRAVVVARYRRTWPVDAGAAAFAETVAPEQDLLARVEQLVVALGWSGIFEVELIRRADGSYAVIDLNPRVYGSLALSQAAGAPLATIWCDTILGRGNGFRTAAAGVAYRCEDFEARHLIADLWHGHPGDALDVLRPHRHAAHAYAELRDPGPVVVRWAGGVARRVHRR